MNPTTEDCIDQLQTQCDEYEQKYSIKELMQKLDDLRQQMRATGSSAKDNFEDYIISEILAAKGYEFYLSILQELDEYEQLRHKHNMLRNRYTALKNLHDATEHIFTDVTEGA